MRNKIFYKKEFELEPFPVYLNVLLYNDVNYLHESLLKEDISITHEAILDNNEKGSIFCVENDIYVTLNVDKIENLGTIAHESVHAVDKIFQIIGQPDHTVANDELIPYYTAYIFNKITNFLIEKKIISLTFKLYNDEK